MPAAQRATPRPPHLPLQRLELLLQPGRLPPAASLLQGVEGVIQGFQQGCLTPAWGGAAGR